MFVVVFRYLYIYILIYYTYILASLWSRNICPEKPDDSFVCLKMFLPLLGKWGISWDCSEDERDVYPGKPWSRLHFFFFLQNWNFPGLLWPQIIVSFKHMISYLIKPFHKRINTMLFSNFDVFLVCFCEVIIRVGYRKPVPL